MLAHMFSARLVTIGLAGLLALLVSGCGSPGGVHDGLGETSTASSGGSNGDGGSDSDDGGDTGGGDDDDSTPDGGGIDLAVTAAAAPQLVLAGSGFLAEITVGNQGGASSPANVPWRLYRDLSDGNRELLQNGNIEDGIPADEEHVVLVDQITKVDDGDRYVLCFVIDPLDAIEESNEDNNERQFQVDLMDPVNNKVQ